MLELLDGDAVASVTCGVGLSTNVFSAIGTSLAGQYTTSPPSSALPTSTTSAPC